MTASTDSICTSHAGSHLACQRLVRYMHQHNLRPGDRLPPQEILRRHFSTGHDTLSPAMQTLVRHGLVRRKPRLGTVVLDRQAPIPGLWTVGLLVYDHAEETDNLFIATLLRFIHGYLAKAGCHWRTYHRTIDRDLDPNRLEDFPQLQDDLDAHHLDAILSPTHLHSDLIARLRQDNLPMCRVGIRQTITCGARINPLTIPSHAAAQLKNAGCRRIAIIGNHVILGLPDSPLRTALRQAIQHVGLASELLLTNALRPGIDNFTAGQAAARAFLDRPADQQPDGLIIFNDVVALGAAETLALASARPRIVVMTNRQVPIVFPLPVIRYELDLAQLAHAAVDMTLQRLWQPDLPEQVRDLSATFAPQQPRCPAPAAPAIATVPL